MPTPIEEELGLGPVMHRLRNRIRNALGRMGMSHAPDDRRSLDPLTVNYAAWDEVRRHARAWPTYREVPNRVEVLVSPEDWDEYWGIDAERKEAAIAAYLRSRAQDKGLWMAGVPQVTIVSDDAVEIGGVEVDCQFLEPVADEEGGFIPTAAPGATVGRTMRAKRTEGDEGHARGAHAAPAADAGEAREDVSFEKTDERCALVGKGGFRLVLSSGDIIGAVSEGQVCPAEVNVRLDASGFPYVEPKQCAIGLIGGRWQIVNHSKRGTKLVCQTGMRLMLKEERPYPLEEGDVIYLGPTRPLRFELS